MKIYTLRQQQPTNAFHVTTWSHRTEADTQHLKHIERWWLTYDYTYYTDQPDTTDFCYRDNKIVATQEIKLQDEYQINLLYVSENI